MSKKKGKSASVAPSQPQEVFEIIDEVVETSPAPAPTPQLSLREQADTIGLEYPLPAEVWKWPCKYCGKGALKDKSTPSPLLNDDWDRCFGMAHSLCWFTETCKELEADGTFERNRKLRAKLELEKIEREKAAAAAEQAVTEKRRKHIQKVNEQRKADRELEEQELPSKVLVQQQEPEEVDPGSFLISADDDTWEVE